MRERHEPADVGRLLRTSRPRPVEISGFAPSAPRSSRPMGLRTTFRGQPAFAAGSMVAVMTERWSSLVNVTVRVSSDVCEVVARKPRLGIAEIRHTPRLPYRTVALPPCEGTVCRPAPPSSQSTEVLDAAVRGNAEELLAGVGAAGEDGCADTVGGATADGDGDGSLGAGLVAGLPRGRRLDDHRGGPGHRGCVAGRADHEPDRAEHGGHAGGRARQPYEQVTRNPGHGPIVNDARAAPSSRAGERRRPRPADGPQDRAVPGSGGRGPPTSGCRSPASTTDRRRPCGRLYRSR